jgi:hypothetical protein
MVRAFMTPVKPQKSNKGFNFYFQMPEFIMKFFNYLHTPLPASVSFLLNMPDLLVRKRSLITHETNVNNRFMHYRPERYTVYILFGRNKVFRGFTCSINQNLIQISRPIREKYQIQSGL